jgi:hypothetical protein
VLCASGLQASGRNIKIDRANQGYQHIWPYGLVQKKRASMVHVAPACARSMEGSDCFGYNVRSLSLHFCKRLVLGLEPMTSWSQGNTFTATRGLPFNMGWYNTQNLRHNPSTTNLIVSHGQDGTGTSVRPCLELRSTQACL